MTSPSVVLDEVDVAILGALQDDASVSNSDLANRIGMSASACLSRTKRLRESGVIRQYVAVVDEAKVGLSVTAFAFITLGAARSQCRRLVPAAGGGHVAGHGVLSRDRRGRLPAQDRRTGYRLISGLPDGHPRSHSRTCCTSRLSWCSGPRSGSSTFRSRRPTGGSDDEHRDPQAESGSARRGDRPEPDSLLGLGTEFKEQNHGLFGWDFVSHKGLHLPDDFVLSDGTLVQFRYRPDSPYEMEMRDGVRVISKGGDVLDTASLIPRPRFYDERHRERRGHAPDRAGGRRGLLLRLLPEPLLPFRPRRGVLVLQPRGDEEDLRLRAVEEGGLRHRRGRGRRLRGDEGHEPQIAARFQGGGDGSGLGHVQGRGPEILPRGKTGQVLEASCGGDDPPAPGSQRPDQGPSDAGGASRHERPSPGGPSWCSG